MKTDDELRLDVIAELGREPGLDASAVGVAVTEGVVTLSGHVSSYGEKIRAEQATQRVTGVRALAQEIEVRIPSKFARDDEQIAEAVANALQWNVWVPAEQIKIHVEDGWVRLNGKVKTGFERASAERAVRELTGVRGVINQIDTEPKADTQTVQQEIARALQETAERDAKRITVEAHDGTIVLRGKVRNWTERADAERAAFSAKGVSKVQNFITVG